MSVREKLKAHFDSLAALHNVKIEDVEKIRIPSDHKLSAFSDRKLRIVHLPPIRSRLTYCIALHELGHVVGLWQSKPLLFREAGAWKWARENSLQWGTIEDQTMYRGMLSYLNAAIDDRISLKKRPLSIPPPDHYFWQCVPVARRAPAWLHEGFFTTPWREILGHPQRPQCGLCTHFHPHHRDEADGALWGTCTNPEDPMGVTPLLPSGALCPSGYEPRELSKLTQKDSSMNEPK